MSGKHKRKPEPIPLLNRKTGLFAVTGALTATTAIASACTVGNGGSAGEPAAAQAPAAGASSEGLLAARDAPRADRGTARPTLQATPKPTPKPVHTRKPRPESIAQPEKRVTKHRRTITTSRSGTRSDTRSDTGGGVSCRASYYDEGQQTASGEPFDPNALTAAHKTLPLGSKVRVTNPSTGESVVVRINDRGPYSGGRCLDLSRAAFDEIASLSSGVIQVRYQVL